MLNIAGIVGRICTSTELRTTGTGVPVCSFTVAVERNHVPQGEERQTDFIDVVAWRNTAEFVSRWFSKGSWIGVDGAIQTRTYEDKNGEKRKSTELIAKNINFVGPKQQDSAQAPEQKPESQGYYRERDGMQYDSDLF